MTTQIMIILMGLGITSAACVASFNDLMESSGTKDTWIALIFLVVSYIPACYLVARLLDILFLGG